MKIFEISGNGKQVFNVWIRNVPKYSIRYVAALDNKTFQRFRPYKYITEA